MNWLVILGLGGLVLIIGGVAYILMSDPQEVDREETLSVRRETAEARKQATLREKADDEAEQLKEKHEFLAGDFE